MKKSYTLAPLLALLIANTSHANTTPSAQQGMELYQAACQLCHAPDKAKAMKAPAAFSVNTWQQRFKQAKKEVKNSKQFNNIADYFFHQISIGKGLMHHGGLCKESQ